MAQLQAKQPRMTFDEFLDWERRQETKHEFVDGVAVLMAGATEAHDIIQMNLLASSLTKLRGGPCRPFPSDMLVPTGTDKGRYPDMTIDCGPRNPANRIGTNPVVVFEVLSPDTQTEDRTHKLADYNTTPSIARYVMVEPPNRWCSFTIEARTATSTCALRRCVGWRPALSSPRWG